MYTEKQISAALELFDRAASITTVVLRQPDYPSRTMLYNWLKKRGTGCRTLKRKYYKACIKSTAHFRPRSKVSRLLMYRT